MRKWVMVVVNLLLGEIFADLIRDTPLEIRDFTWIICYHLAENILGIGPHLK